MSASREKKKRQELGSVPDPKAARIAEEKAAARKSDILYATVAIVIAVIAVALVVYNSGIIQRNQTAVTIDGQNYNVAKTSYYYQRVCSNYASMFGQEYLQSLKSQSFNDTQTWDDYFKEQTVENMKFIHAASSAAKAAGMSLDADDKDVVKSNVDSVKSAARSAGYSYGAYLKAVYGPYMTGSVFQSCLEDQVLVSKYVNQYTEDNFVYTDAEIEAYYDENKNTYDLVNGGYVSVNGAPEIKTDSEGNTIEATDEEVQAALDEAKKIAETILAEVKKGTSLESLADRYDNVTYTGGEELSSTSSVPSQWLFDESRKSGDVELLDNADNSYYYVARFNSRTRQEDVDYNVRHILVTDANLNLAEGETATEAQLTAKAQEILSTWDGTEDGFAKLAEQFSQDGGSNTNGGLYENVPKNYMVAPFEEWCYEEGRQSGDTGVIYYSGTGAHVMYFVGYGDTPYWYSACENALRSNASNAWQSSLTESTTAEINAGGMKNVG